MIVVTITAQLFFKNWGTSLVINLVLKSKIVKLDYIYLDNVAEMGGKYNIKKDKKYGHLFAK